MVAIKDMEMPKGCVSCNFCTDDWCCKIQHKYINNFIPNHINRDPNCPLVEIGTCKDCKHFHNVRKDFNTCDLWTIACADNHYCADFEKRSNENG